MIVISLEYQLLSIPFPEIVEIRFPLKNLNISTQLSIQEITTNIQKPIHLNTILLACMLTIRTAQTCKCKAPTKHIWMCPIRIAPTLKPAITTSHIVRNRAVFLKVDFKTSSLGIILVSSYSLCYSSRCRTKLFLTYNFGSCQGSTTFVNVCNIVSAIQIGFIPSSKTRIVNKYPHNLSYQGVCVSLSLVRVFRILHLSS